MFLPPIGYIMCLMKKIFIVPLAGLLILAGCSSLINEREAGLKAVGMAKSVNAGEDRELQKLSARPFLFEGEILPTETMLENLWQGLIDAGVTFDDPQVKEIRVVDGDSYRVFSQAWEVETWFKNYVTEPAYLVFLDTEDQQLVFIIDRTRKSRQKILGFGEVRE